MGKGARISGIGSTDLIARQQVILTVLRDKPLKIRALLTFLTCFLWAAAYLAPAAVRAEEPTARPGSPVSPDYRIGPGDSLHIFVFENEQLTVTVPVRPDGKISTPLVEDMVAVGKTPSQLARDIEVALERYVKTPKVNVEVLTALSIYSQVKVIGQVKEPQAMPYHEGMTVLEALLGAKGMTQFAAGNRARISRMVGGKQQDIKVKLDALVNSGDLTQNLVLQPGDVLVVPETRF
jgi:polysaccharide export outer membrane protein